MRYLRNDGRPCPCSGMKEPGVYSRLLFFLFLGEGREGLTGMIRVQFHVHLFSFCVISHGITILRIIYIKSTHFHSPQICKL